MRGGSPGKLKQAARALYEKPPSKEELAGLGLSIDDLDQPLVWPENWAAFSLFSDLQTQWRAGMNGPTGLDYNVLFRKLDRMGLSDDEYDDLEQDIRVMEFEALSVMHEKND